MNSIIPARQGKTGALLGTRLFACLELPAGETAAGREGAEIFASHRNELIRFGEPVNHVLEVDIDGDDVTFNLYDLP